MRKICFLLIFLALPFLVCAQNIPQPEGWVNDFAGVISPEYKGKLNALIEELEQKTTAEIAVVTVDSISPYGEIEYARLLFDNWKPGKKGKDNGVLVLLAIKERRWRIETGYGVEGILPDGLCGEIGRNYMVPYFKGGKYSEGLYNGVAVIANIIAKDAGVEIAGMKNIKLKPKERYPIEVIILTLILVPIWFIFSLFSWPLFIFTFGFLWGILNFSMKKPILIFLMSMFFLRFLFWKFVPRPKFINDFMRFSGGLSGSFGGGGFGGGGFGGGGFGGGGGGGGGAGGGF